MQNKITPLASILSSTSIDTHIVFNHIGKYVDTNIVQYIYTHQFSDVNLIPQSKFIPFLQSKGQLIFHQSSEDNTSRDDFILLKPFNLQNILVYITYTTINRMLITKVFGINQANDAAYINQLHTDFVNFLQPYTVSISDDPHLAKISFTYMHKGNVASVFSRNITCPQLDEIRNNYPTIMPNIDYLFSLNEPDKIGKFIFWHSPPGQGKTYLIRSLLLHWKRIASCYYITDPENFFHNTSYMHDVLLTPRDQDDDDDSLAWFIEGGDSMFDNILQKQPSLKSNGQNPKNQFCLYVIEDGLDFILSGSHSTESAAISRLLNLCDGILGQGLRFIFLITSNEKIHHTDIHKAFLRPGRCLQELYFPNFSKEEAIHWLTSQGHKEKVSIFSQQQQKLFSLAELYTIINDSFSPLQVSKKLEHQSLGLI